MIAIAYGAPGWFGCFLMIESQDKKSVALDATRFVLFGGY